MVGGPGDHRPSTDGRFARTLGCPFVLVRSGVVPPDAPLPTEVPVAADHPDLASVADRLTAVPPGAG